MHVCAHKGERDEEKVSDKAVAHPGVWPRASAIQYPFALPDSSIETVKL